MSVPGVRLYDAADYRLAFLSILGSAVIGLIAALSLNEVPLAHARIRTAVLS